MAAHVAHAVAQTDRGLSVTRGQPVADSQRIRMDVCVDPYLVSCLAGRTEEMLLYLFYGEDGTFRAEGNWEGSPSSVTADRRDLVRAVVAHDARYVVMAHNHPSGKAWPSGQDIVATRQMYRLFEALGVTLVDHVIVACDGLIFSFKEAGLV